MAGPEVKQKIIDIIDRGTDPVSEISTEEIADKIIAALTPTMMLLAKNSFAAERSRCAAIAWAVYERAGGRGGDPRDKGSPADTQNYWRRVAAEEIAEAIGQGDE